MNTVRERMNLEIQPKNYEKKPKKDHSKKRREMLVLCASIIAITLFVNVGALLLKKYRPIISLTIPTIETSDIIKSANGLAEVDSSTKVITFTLKKSMPDAINFKLFLNAGETIHAEGENAYIGGGENNYFVVKPFVMNAEHKITISNALVATTYRVEYYDPNFLEGIAPDITNNDIIGTANGAVYVDEEKKEIIFTLQSIRDSAVNFMVALKSDETLSCSGQDAYISGETQNYVVMKPPVVGGDYSITISNPRGVQVYKIIVQRKQS